MTFTVVEASIAELGRALSEGIVTSVELVERYLNRIAYYDRSGISLNALVVLNPEMFESARAADLRRSRGEVLGPLDGIPYTAKDSYKARGLTVAAGSPAFRDLVATDDAFTIARLRAAGAVLIGLTNMPPMANGGMQRGVYGRAESPYNAEYLTAAFGSGSSNGSGTATAASFAAFGLGEETWSSGRAPASNNALVAYTPSRGVISVRGNWPLVPTMDVVVPHTRSMDDLLTVLDGVVADDPDTRGDFWRTQPWVPILAASSVRPPSYLALREAGALRGRRLGIPRLYINRDEGVTAPIETRSSILELWRQAAADLAAAGAELVEVDLPVVSNYEGDRPGAPTLATRGFVPDGFADSELWQLSMLGWHDFLDANGDPALHALADVDGPMIFPQPTGALPDRYGDFDFDLADYVARAQSDGITPLDEIPFLEQGLTGLERTRTVDLEEWLDAQGVDAIVFPAVADVGPADADTNPDSAALAWRNGTWVANGNLVWRHLGIPTVTVPMGVMSDTRMPVGLTFAGKAYDDSTLLGFAYAYESASHRRVAPPRTPPLPGECSGGDDGLGKQPGVGATAAASDPDSVSASGSVSGSGSGSVSVSVAVETSTEGEGLRVVAFGRVARTSSEKAAPDRDAGDGESDGGGDVEPGSISVWVNGVETEVVQTGCEFRAQSILSGAQLPRDHSEWFEPHAPLVIATCRVDGSVVAGAFA